MKKSNEIIATVLVTLLLLLLVVLSFGLVDVPMSVMYSLFLCILFVLALLVIPKAFERHDRKKKKRA